MGCLGLAEVNIDEAIDDAVGWGFLSFRNRGFLVSQALGPAVIRLAVAQPLDVVDKNEFLGRLEPRQLRPAKCV